MKHFEEGPQQISQARFVRGAMKKPVLSRDREYELALAWREEGDSDALQELIGAYLRLAIAVAARYKNYGLPMSDMIQEGTIGLLQAADRFEPGRGVRFSTYASWWIRSSVQDFVLRNWSVVRIGSTAAQKSLFFRLWRLRNLIERATGESLNHRGREEIAAQLGTTTNDVQRMEGCLSGSDLSLNAKLGGADLSEDGGEWQDVLIDERPRPEEIVIQRRDQEIVGGWINEALEDLNQREKLIISSRKLTEDGATLGELGRMLGLSKERVRQIESRALEKMRKGLLARVGEPGELFAEQNF
ncbi:MAG: RNA polymerase factor sigma-32 [Pseudomonadota bacterium]